MKDVSFSFWLPFWTLFTREVLRFMRVVVQTLVTPTLTAALYLFIFGFSLGDRISVMEGLSFAEFVIPGLILMGIIQNAFQNTSSSIFMSRFIGNIVDYLVTPLTATQFILAHTLAAMLRGLIVGAAVWGISFFFAVLPWTHPVYAFFMVVLTSFMFAQFGIIAGIHSNNWDHLAVFGNFFIMPLVFLGGVFYPINILPEFWERFSALNPIYYLVDGFRYGALGVSEKDPLLCLAIGACVALALFAWAAILIAKGYKMRT